MNIRRSDERGRADYGWLKALYSFSFANYHNPAHTRFRTLRVLNEDRVQPGTGFGTHGHEDMEIFTYVLEGSLKHSDNTGEEGVLRPGDLQLMSAGTGIEHSEFNADEHEELHLMQVWFFPDRRGYQPRYQQRHFDQESRRDRLRLVASPSPDDEVLQIRQDARLFASILGSGKTVEHRLGDGRGIFLQLARGTLAVRSGIDTSETPDAETLQAGDAAMIEDPGTVSITAAEESEFLLFDLG